MKHDRYSSKPAGRPAQKLIGGGKTLNISVVDFTAEEGLKRGFEFKLPYENFNDFREE